MPPPPRAKVPPYLLMLVVSFALVGLIGYQTLKDRKISGDLLLENQTLKELLKKEKKRASDLQYKFTKLSSQKEELNGLREGLSGQLIELTRVKNLTEQGKKKVESSLLEKEAEVKDLKEKLSLLDAKEQKLKLMKKEIVEKDAEISELKGQLNAAGKDSSERLETQLTNTSQNVVKDEEEADEKKETMAEHSPSFGHGIAKEASDDEETEDTKPEATTNGHTKEPAEASKKKKSHAQGRDLEDEDLKSDDTEETPTNEDAREEDSDADRVHDEDDSYEQPDVDMDVVNKADLDDNEMAAME